MEVTHTLLKDVQVIKSPMFRDQRGAFAKLFNKQADAVQKYDIKQVNYVQNKEKGILRGLHYQTGAFAESKFFRVLTGRVQVAFIDLRTANYNHECAKTFILDAPNVGLLIPRGFATGYLTLEDNSDVLYYSDNVYEPSAERGIRWDDPLFRIQWLSFNPDLSTKDRAWADFAPAT